MVRGFGDEIIAKLRVPAVVPLTGALRDMRFQSKNVRESDPGSNHDVPKSNHGEDGEPGLEQDKNSRTGLLQEDRT
jgi:hypothetical protein